MPELSSSKPIFVRVCAMVFSCVALSVTINGNFMPRGGVFDWCMFSWVFSFTCSLLVLLVELCGLQTWIPVSWTNFPITVACYAALFCLTTSILFPMLFIRNSMYSRVQNNCITATVFSCLATVTYLGEVIQSKARPGEVAGYMATVPGLIKVCQTFVACVILILANNPVSYEGYASLQWCMAVYCICFILSMVVVLRCVCNCFPIPASEHLLTHAIVGVAMYVSATVLWPLFQFHEQYEGKGPKADAEFLVAVFTGLNLLLYVADMAYSAKTTPLSLFTWTEPSE